MCCWFGSEIGAEVAGEGARVPDGAAVVPTDGFTGRGEVYGGRNVGSWGAAR